MEVLADEGQEDTKSIGDQNNATGLQPGQEHNMRITANGGESLSVRLDIKLSALEFLAKMKGGPK